MSCFGESESLDRDQNIPVVKESPDRINIFLKLLVKEGVHVTKVNKRGSSSRKVIIADQHLTKLTYAPTSKKHGASFPIRNVWRVDCGIDASAGLRKADLIDGESFPVALMMKDGYVLSVVFDTDVEQTLFADSIAFLVRTRRAVLSDDPHRMRVMEVWMQADANGDKRLSFKELCDVLEKLNCNIDRTMLKKKFQAADEDGNGSLDFIEFSKFYGELTCRPELRLLFDAFSSDPQKKFLTEADFSRFFSVAQGDSLSPAVVHRIAHLSLGGTASKLPTTEPITLGFDEFIRFLLNPTRNGWMNPVMSDKVYQDMTQPLTRYFINSSHNTYLSGDQLQSDSKVEMYKMCLEAGCRCVELDIWDGPGDEPVIYHGYTRTSKILCRDVLTQIRQSAFVASPYPIILSLEIHTSKVQSNVVASQIRQIFAGVLYTFADAEADGHSKNSPEALKNKVLVKWKLTDDGDDDEDDLDGADEAILKERERIKAERQKEHKKHDHGELGRTVMVAAMKTKTWGAEAKWFNCETIGENRILKIAKTDPDNLRLQNTRMLTRIYPAGSRINSSNYEPSPMWEHGCQIVALNFQTWDEPMRLNAGRFQQNGGCGYVLMPAHLRDASLPRPTKQYTLRVGVLLGSQLPKPLGAEKGEIIDPYVTLSIHGSAVDMQANQPARTNFVNDNGFSPSWNEWFDFKVTDLEVAMLRISCYDKDPMGKDDQIGESALPIPMIRLGYRAVPLKGVQDGRPLENAVLLCHFSLFDSPEEAPKAVEVPTA
jgi:hypothetical protein